MEILKEEVQLTVERPDKIMVCQDSGTSVYIKKFRGKGELIVIAETINNKVNELDIKCFGWAETMFYPS